VLDASRQHGDIARLHRYGRVVESER